MIRIGQLKDLTGIGEEYLIDSQGNVLAKFIDGELQGTIPRPSQNDTVWVTI